MSAAGDSPAQSARTAVHLFCFGLSSASLRGVKSHADSQSRRGHRIAGFACMRFRSRCRPAPRAGRETTARPHLAARGVGRGVGRSSLQGTARVTRATVVQGNCTAEPSESFRRRISGAPLARFTDGQCLLLAQNHLLAATEGKVLIENLYIRYASGGAGFGFEQPTDAPVPTLLHVHGGDVYVRNVRVQGDGQSACRGFIAYPTGRVLIEGAAPTSPTAADEHGAALMLRC